MSTDAKTLRAMEIVAEITDIKNKLEANKPLYERLDDLTEEFGEIAEVNQTLATNDGRFATLVDNFADKNTVYRPAAVRRFEIEILTQQELDKKTAKAKKKEAT